MGHAIRSTSRPHPDVNRIAGIAAAITLNAALLMLLLVPISAPPPLTVEHVPYRWVLPADKQPEPQKPIPVTVTRPPSAITPPVRLPRTQTPAIVDQIMVEHGSLPVDPPVDTLVGETASAPPHSAPLPGVRLEYLQAPAPAYPRAALREGLQGTVLLRVLVDVDGKPLEVQVARSSGERDLDRAAREQVLRHWIFRPAMKDGRAVQAIGLVPIAFNLH